MCALVSHLATILTFQSVQGPPVPKDAVPAEVTPARNEVAPPPRQPECRFQKPSASGLASLSRTLRQARRIRQAPSAIREAVFGSRLLLSPRFGAWKAKGRSSV